MMIKCGDPLLLDIHRSVCLDFIVVGLVHRISWFMDFDCILFILVIDLLHKHNDENINSPNQFINLFNCSTSHHSIYYAHYLIPYLHLTSSSLTSYYHAPYSFNWYQIHISNSLNSKL